MKKGSVTFNGIDFPYTAEKSVWEWNIIIPDIHFDEIVTDEIWNMHSYVYDRIKEYHEMELSRLARWQESAREG